MKRYILFFSVLIISFSCNKEQETVDPPEVVEELDEINFLATVRLPNTAYDDDGELYFYSIVEGDDAIWDNNIVEVGFCKNCTGSDNDRSVAVLSDEDGFITIAASELKFDYTEDACYSYVIFKDNVVIDGPIISLDQQENTLRSTGGYVLDPLPREFVSLREIADFGGVARSEALAFSIGNDGYLGSGQDEEGNILNDFWKYDSVNNSWTEKASIPKSFYRGFSFVHNDIGYVGGGIDQFENAQITSVNANIFAYDPQSDVWDQKAEMPRGLSGCGVFTEEEKAYFFGGTFFTNQSGYGNRGYVYDINKDVVRDTFVYGSVQTNFAIATTDNGKVFSGGGLNSGNEFFSLNGSNWKSLDEFPGSEVNNLIAFNLGESVYFGLGNKSEAWRVDLYRYDSISEVWITVGIKGGLKRIFSETEFFKIGDKIFIGTGLDLFGKPTKKMYELVIE